MVEWVEPKAYTPWEPPKIIPDIKVGRKEADKEDGEKKTKKKSPAKKPSEKAPESPAPTAETRRARPHPGKAGEIEGPPKSKGLVPVKDIPSGPRVPTGPSRPHGGRTVADAEAGRQALGDLVKTVMAEREGKYSDRRGWRNLGNLNTGSIHTGEIVEPPAVSGRGVPSLEGGAASPRALPTRQSASTERLQRVQIDDTVPLRRDQTRELPRVGTQFDQTIDFQAIAPAKTPFAVRSPLPMGSGRSPEQLSLFHVPGEPVNPSLSTRQQGPIAMPSGSRVSKLAARPTPGKKPGDQGTLFQPARYRSVT